MHSGVGLGIVPLKRTGRQMTLEQEHYFTALRATEQAAIAAHSWVGRGDEKAADQAAVNAMRAALNQGAMDGTVVIGEGERDEAPMLYIGEKVGSGSGKKVDIALDPLEGTTICATGGIGSLAVLALGEAGAFLHAPDTYMEKLAVGPDVPADAINLDFGTRKNLDNIAQAKSCDVEDIVVCVLDRPRHETLIREIRDAGAKVFFIKDGDIAAVLDTVSPDGNIDVYMGSGGAPEGVLAAAALSCMGGQMVGRLLFRNDEEKQRATKMGITDFERQYRREDLAKGDIIFSATGVTSGPLLLGVNVGVDQVTTETLILQSSTRSIRTIMSTYPHMDEQVA